MSLAVLDAGWASRVVDAGRPALRRFGLPVGGAADRAALAIGNALVGNDATAAALEMAVRGPRLRADGDVACVVYGAPFALSGPSPDVAAGTTFTLRSGEELHVGGTPHGMRAYLCIRGGFQGPLHLGSRAALRCIRTGDTLPYVNGRIRRRFAPALSPAFPPAWRLRAVPGLQSSWFQDAAFYGQDFTVRPESDRMGVRLHGAPLEVPACELISEPVAPGAVQVTRDGQCVVLGVDGQTIGGYPKIAHVIQADLDCLGQVRPGERVQFVPVSLADAIGLFRERQSWLRGWVLRLQASLGD